MLEGINSHPGPLITYTIKTDALIIKVDTFYN
jgi:hypothetical protein